MTFPVKPFFSVEDIPMPQFWVILFYQIHPNENYTLEKKRNQVYYLKNKT